MVAFGFHFGFGFGFEVQAYEGLGVGAADVEPPGGIFKAEAVQLHLVGVGVCAAEFVEYEQGVGDGGVDFAAGEVALHGDDELGEGLVGLGDEVGDEYHRERR